MKKQKTVRTELLCPNCNSITPIQRKKSKLKELYHLKKLYCYYCNKTVKQIEVRDKDMLLAKLQFTPCLSSEEQELLNCLQLTKKRNGYI